LDTCLDAIARFQREARAAASLSARPRWPLIVLRTPKGWTGPKEVDGVPVEGTFRAHQVPLSGVRTHPEHLAQLESWMKSYRPEELFAHAGALVPQPAALAPRPGKRMGENPHANGGTLTAPLHLPDYREYALTLSGPGRDHHESTRRLGLLL